MSSSLSLQRRPGWSKWMYSRAGPRKGEKNGMQARSAAAPQNWHLGEKSRYSLSPLRNLIDVLSLVNFLLDEGWQMKWNFNLSAVHILIYCWIVNPKQPDDDYSNGNFPRQSQYHQSNSNPPPSLLFSSSFVLGRDWPSDRRFSATLAELSATPTGSGGTTPSFESGQGYHNSLNEVNLWFKLCNQWGDQSDCSDFSWFHASKRNWCTNL